MRAVKPGVGRRAPGMGDPGGRELALAPRESCVEGLALSGAACVLLSGLLLRGGLTDGDVWALSSLTASAGGAYLLGARFGWWVPAPLQWFSGSSLALVGLIQLATLSAAWSDYPLTALRTAGLLSGGLVVLWLGMTAGSTVRGLSSVAVGVSVSGTAMAMSSLAGLAGVVPGWRQELDGAVLLAGPFGYANAAAAFFLLTLPASAALLVRSEWYPAQGRLRSRRMLGFGGMIVQSLALVLTRSRGAELALAVAVAATAGLVLVCSWGRREGSSIGVRRRAARAYVSLLVAVGFMALAAPVCAHIPDGTPVDWSSSNRVQTWRAALAAAEEHLVVGWGAGSFLPAYRPYRVGATTAYAHNVFIQHLVELGLLGVSLLVVMLAALLRAGCRALRGESRAVAACLLTGVVAFTLHNLVDLGWYFGTDLYLFMFVGGALAGPFGAGRGIVRARPAFRKPGLRLLTAALVSLFMVGAIWASVAEGLDRRGGHPDLPATDQAAAVNPGGAAARAAYEAEMVRSLSAATRVLFTGGETPVGATATGAHMARVYGLRARALVLRALLALADGRPRVAVTAVDQGRIELKRAMLTTGGEWDTALEEAQRLIAGLPALEEDPVRFRDDLTAASRALEPLLVRKATAP